MFHIQLKSVFQLMHFKIGLFTNRTVSRSLKFMHKTVKMVGTSVSRSKRPDLFRFQLALPFGHKYLLFRSVDLLQNMKVVR